MKTNVYIDGFNLCICLAGRFTGFSWKDEHHQFALLTDRQHIKEATHFPVIIGALRTVVVSTVYCYPPFWIIGRPKKFRPQRVGNGTNRIAVTL